MRLLLLPKPASIFWSYILYLGLKYTTVTAQKLRLLKFYPDQATQQKNS